MGGAGIFVLRRPHRFTTGHASGEGRRAFCRLFDRRQPAGNRRLPPGKAERKPACGVMLPEKRFPVCPAQRGTGLPPAPLMAAGCSVSRRRSPALCASVGCGFCRRSEGLLQCSGRKKRGPGENKFGEEPAAHHGAGRSVAERGFEKGQGGIVSRARQADAVFQSDARAPEQLERRFLGAPCHEGGRCGIAGLVVAIFAGREKLFAQAKSTRAALFQIDAGGSCGREVHRHERAGVGDADVCTSLRQIRTAVRPVPDGVAALERATQQQALGQPFLAAFVGAESCVVGSVCRCCSYKQSVEPVHAFTCFPDGCNAGFMLQQPV